MPPAAPPSAKPAQAAQAAQAAVGGWQDGAHCWPLRVYYEDTDFSGLVYHAAYLRFAERGRSEFLRAAGITHRALLRRRPPVSPVAFVVTAMQMRFLAPARMDDALEVRTSLRRLGAVRLRMAQEMRRGAECLWQGTCELACIVPEYGAEAQGRARLVRVPPALRDKLAPCLRPETGA